MKDLITTIGSILILSIFIMQFAVNENTLGRTMAIEKNLYKFMADMRREEVVDEEGMREKLAMIAGCQHSEVELKLGEGEFSLRLPIYKVIGAEKLVGLRKEDNKLWYHREGIF